MMINGRLFFYRRCDDQQTCSIMKYFISNIIIVIVYSIGSPCSGEITDAELLAGVNLGIQERYDDAIRYFSALQQKNPQDAAPRFFLATIWQTRMMDFESSQWREKFMSEIEATVELSASRLKENPKSIRARFYLGSALSYKSFQISREKKYLRGIRLALKGISEINQVIKEDSSFYDAYIGIGSYLYWRSYLTRNFSWLPFFSDQREKGIKLIKTSCDKGRLSKWAALSNLAWIYIQERRFKEAIQCATTGLERFPNTRAFLWPLGDAEYQNGDFDAALKTYKTLLRSVTAEGFNNHYNEIVLNVKIAQCYFELEKWQKARSFAQQVLIIKADKKIKKRLKAKKEKARDMLREIDYILNEKISSDARKKTTRSPIEERSTKG